jgi:hypothetical protein
MMCQSWELGEQERGRGVVRAELGRRWWRVRLLLLEGRRGNSRVEVLVGRRRRRGRNEGVLEQDGGLKGARHRKLYEVADERELLAQRMHLKAFRW